MGLVGVVVGAGPGSGPSGLSQRRDVGVVSQSCSNGEEFLGRY